MESLFSRLFKYRSSDKRIQQENFLTEIFAFLLEDKNVPGLLASFLNEFGITTQNQLEKFRVETQHPFYIDSDKIIPDITIKFSIDKQRWLVFIENKVSALEGENQLAQYLNYLEKEADQGTKCVLLYITRFYDPKPAPSDKIGFGQMRWWQIHEMLDKFIDNPFVSEARLFMEENNLNLSKNFSDNHIKAMMHWNETKEMMDASLGDIVEEKFKEVTKGKYSSNSVNKNLRDYGDYFQAVGDYFWFGMGYFIANSGDENSPGVGGAIVVEPSYSNRVDAVEALKEFTKKNNSWELIGNSDSEDELIWITKGQSLDAFRSATNHISAIQKWFLEVLSDVEVFQKDYPDLTWG